MRHMVSMSEKAQTLNPILYYEYNTILLESTIEWRRDQLSDKCFLPISRELGILVWMHVESSYQKQTFGVLTRAHYRLFYHDTGFS